MPRIALQPAGRAIGGRTATCSGAWVLISKPTGHHGVERERGKEKGRQTEPISAIAHLQLIHDKEGA